MFEKSAKHIIFAVIVLGFTTIATQIILLREFLSVFNGNEIVIGIILANWMLLTGLGSFFGRYFLKIRKKIQVVSVLILLLSIIPVITDLLIHKLRIIIIHPGSIISAIQVFLFSFLSLLPFCLISGFLFTTFCSIFYENMGVNQTGRVYSHEATGSIAGGSIISLILVPILPNFTILFIISLLSIFSAMIILPQVNNYVKYFFFVVSILSVLFISGIKPDYFLKSLLFKGQEILHVKDTPYGNIVVTRTQGQINFFENGSLLFSTGNQAENEEAVHYTMVQHKCPGRILLISGGIKGLVPEIIKYYPDTIDYVEINPELIELGKKYVTELQDKRLNVIIKDARLYIKHCKAKYDIVIINLPPPSTASLNRYYSAEFFSELNKKLNNGAVISLSLMSTSDYVSKEAGQLNSVIFNTLKTIFMNVLIVPGGKNYFIASNSNLSTGIASLIENRGIANIYVNQYYLNDDRLKERSKFIMDNLKSGDDVNHDFSPLSYSLQLKIWLNYFSSNYAVFLIICAAILCIFLIFLHPVDLSMFSVGFAASSFEFILIITFQIIYGYVYNALGVIIAIFMGGLAAGSYFFQKAKQSGQKTFMYIQFGVVAFSALLPFVLLAINKASENVILIYCTFSVLALVSGILTGAAFSVSSSIRKETVIKSASMLYFADLIGSAAGLILVSVFLFPLTGLVNTCLIIGLINIISIVVNKIRV